MVRRRRIVLIDAAVALSGTLLAPALGFCQVGRKGTDSADAGQSISFEWELPEDFAKPVRARLGAAVERTTTAPASSSDRSAPVIVIIVGAAALTSLAQVIISSYRDVRYGGVIIEDRGESISIKTDPRLSSRVIIVKDKRGVTVHEMSGSPNAKDVLEGLSKLDAARSGSAGK
jgi:hypothetical protein